MCNHVRNHQNHSTHNLADDSDSDECVYSKNNKEKNAKAKFQNPKNEKKDKQKQTYTMAMKAMVGWVMTILVWLLLYPTSLRVLDASLIALGLRHGPTSNPKPRTGRPSYIHPNPKP